MNYTRQVATPTDANGTPFEAYVSDDRLSQYRPVGLCNLGFAVLTDGDRVVNALLYDGDLAVHEREFRGTSVVEHVVDFAEGYGPWDHVADSVREAVRQEYGHVPEVDSGFGPRNDDRDRESPEETLSLDERLRVLSNGQRRRLLGRLVETGSIDETHVPVVVADGLVDIEGAVVQAYNVHLPVLDGKGVIDWDDETGVVHRGSEFEGVEPLVNLVAKYQEGERGPDDAPTDPDE